MSYASLSYSAGSRLATVQQRVGLQSRVDRKAAKESARARKEYSRRHRPDDFGKRRREYVTAMDRLESETRSNMSKIRAEISQLEHRMSVSSHRANLAIKARVDALRSMLEDHRLAYQTARETLILNFQDVLEYERVLTTF